MKDILIEFIEENNLNFNCSGSGLNSACTILSGYALYMGVLNPGVIKEAINQVFPKSVGKYEKELERVFEYAENNNYSGYWNTIPAKLQYKF